MMKTIQQFGTFEDEVLVNALRELENQLDNLEQMVIGLFQAPTGVGKTHAGIQLITPIFYLKRGVRLVFFVAPQKQLVGRVSLQRHIKELKRKGILVSELYEPKVGEIQSTLRGRDEDELVFVTMSDSFFNRNVHNFKRLIECNDLVNNTLVILDEAHYGSTSEKSLYKDNTGNVPSTFNAVKFNNIVSVLDIVYVLGLTATPTKEQKDDNFGSTKYVPVNTYPAKSDLWKRTSSYQTPVFYDWENWGMEKSLMKFFEMVNDHQMITDADAKENNLPLECQVKFCGGIKIETPYMNKEKDDRYTLNNILNGNISIPNHYDWDLALDTSDGIEVWDFSGGEVTQLTDEEMNQRNYFDSDMLIEHLREKESRLRFLVVVNKGTMGIDISNLNFGLALRVPGTIDSEGVPVTLSGEQWNGRFSRITIPIEKLSQHFTDEQKFIKYYLLVNSYRQMLPESLYWRTMMENISQKLNSVDEVSKILNNL